MVARTQVGLIAIGAFPLCVGLSMPLNLPLTLSVTESFRRNSKCLSSSVVLRRSPKPDARFLDAHAHKNCARSWKTAVQRFSGWLSNSEFTYHACAHRLDKYAGPIRNADGGVKAIVFYFSGHGMDGDRIITNDHKDFLYLEDIVEPLVTHESIGDTCDKIPKLFMVDACRGNRQLGRNPYRGR